VYKDLREKERKASSFPKEKERKERGVFWFFKIKKYKR